MQALSNLNQDGGKLSSIVNTGGLNATETGAVDDAVLRFDAVAPTIVGPPGAITETTTANNGTIVTINRAGWYHVQLVGVTTANTVVDVGISANVAAAGLNSDPDYAIAGFLAVQRTINSSGAPTNLGFMLNHKFEVLKGAAQLVRFHATDGSDGAPNFSATLATVYYRIEWIGDTRGHS